MIVKLIPETDEEKNRIQEVEHHNVKEFFMFGSKKDADGEVVDFHDWAGGYRYLMGSLYFFLETISDEQRTRSANTTRKEIVLPTPPLELMKKEATQEGPVEVIDTDNLQEEGPATPEIPQTEEEVVEALEEVANESPKAIPFRQPDGE